MKILIILFFLSCSKADCGDPLLIGHLVSLDKQSGEVVLGIENATKSNIFIRIRDIEYPSYTTFSGGVAAGVSGGDVTEGNELFLFVQSKQKNQVRFKLRHFADIEPGNVDQIEMTFLCKCSFAGSLDWTKIQFIVRSKLSPSGVALEKK